MPLDTRIDELLNQWDQLRAQERVLSAEELCADCPELVDEVKKRLQALQALDRVLDVNTDSLEGITPTRDESGGAPVIPASSTPAGLRYRPLRFHAKGGLGEVYVALDEELHREVALKRIQTPHAHHRENCRRFILEAEVTGRLEHPGVVPVYGLGQDGAGRPVYAMRFIQGETLQEAIQRFHRADLPGGDPSARSLMLRQLLTRFVAVCNTVAYAHSRGILHRDLKPANIMLGDYGETLVVDWGLAKQVRRPASRVKNLPGQMPTPE